MDTIYEESSSTINLEAKKQAKEIEILENAWNINGIYAEKDRVVRKYFQVKINYANILNYKQKY